MNRFLEKYSHVVEPDPFGGCLLWAGSLHESGYGIVSEDYGRTRAHRRSYEAEHGEIPDGLFICHKCDVRACVNPSHLFAGTAADNARDCVSKGRGTDNRGEKHGNAKLTREQALDVLRLAESGVTQAAIAEKYGMAQASISLIVTGKNWASLERQTR